MVLILLAVQAGAAQAAPAVPSPEAAWQAGLDKYPGLLPEFGRLADKLQHNVQLPPVRSQSRLLPLLPQATTFYAAFPNYGNVARQALAIFREELQESQVLRDWWQQGELAAAGPKVEDSLEKFHQVSEYLGDEIVVSAAMEGREPSLLIVAEVRKPGLKILLQKSVQELAGKSKLAVQIMDLQELPAAEDRGQEQQLEVLVRPDFLVATLDLATLRSFNARLGRSKQGLVSTAFGQRIAEAYKDGAGIVVAADLQKILRQVPSGANREQDLFRRSGFADMKYLVWEHKTVPGQATSQTELSFIGPRHGVASWLGAPAHLGSLDFVSPNAMMAASVVLSSPLQIFSDIEELFAGSNPNGFAAIAQLEQALKLSLREDLLSQLAGEITLELDGVATPAPAWKAILRVNDSNRLELALRSLMLAAQLRVEQYDEGGVTYHIVRIPSPKASFEIAYAFVDQYLIVASSAEAVAEGVRLHMAGGSLGNSRKFLASLPPGHASGISALFYQDTIAMAALQLRQAAPGMAGAFSQLAGESTPVAVCAYGEETAIRTASTSAAVDNGAVMIAAAIAIPNLLRARIAANEASAVAMVRTVDTAQVTYSVTYPNRGYAPDLATLGLDPRNGTSYSAEHAGLIDATLGNESCTAGAWCAKSGFRFSVAAVCEQRLCTDFVVVATPVAPGTGGKSFCSTSEAVIRFNAGAPLTEPISASECQTWAPLH